MEIRKRDKLKRVKVKSASFFSGNFVNCKRLFACEYLCLCIYECMSLFFLCKFIRLITHEA